MAARRSLLFSFVAVSATSFALRVPAAGPDPAGVWQGTLTRNGFPLEMELAFEHRGAALDGYFTAARLRAVRIPLSAVRFDVPRLGWRLIGDTTTMVAEGEIAGDQLEGNFTEGAASGSFVLQRAAATRVPAREEEISFEGDGGVALSGAIVWPPGGGPFPGVVFLHGSGAEGRWASRYLAHEFARAGIAALIYDKRGVGASRGDWRTAGFEELVKDAAAAVEALRRRRGIDAARVGIHGHSQGGTIAPWVASSNANVAYLIASGASGVDMAAAEIYSLDQALRVPSLAPDDRRLAERFVRALVATAYGGAPRSQLDDVRRQAEGRPWLIALPPDSSPYWTFSKRIAGYDPLAYWRRVHIPALLVYGERDERVPVTASIERIKTSASPEAIVFPGADHTFRVRQDAGDWPQSAAGYPQRVIDWALRVTGR